MTFFLVVLIFWLREKLSTYSILSLEAKELKMKPFTSLSCLLCAQKEELNGVYLDMQKSSSILRYDTV